MAYHDLLGVAAADATDLLEHFERATYEGREYLHLSDTRHGVERGTVLVDGTVVRGFPKIPRTLVLDPGIRRFFDGPFAVEEKLNGYNVRLARVGDDVLAFTRSGYVCPFTTRTVPDRLAVGDFFDDHPDLLLCGEAIGPENPYTDHDYPTVDSLAFHVFDIRHRESGDPLSVDRRRRLCDDYGFPQARSFGVFDPASGAAAVRDVIEELDSEDREGVVMKSLDGRKLLKYTTSAANQGSLAYAFAVPFDYGPEFLFPRVMREAFQSVEFGESEEAARARAHALGESILLPAVRAIREVEREGATGEEHTVRGPPEAIDGLFEHLERMKLRITVLDDEVEEGERVVTFLKHSASTTDSVQSYLDGQTFRA
ncbi:putative ATP-dependent DNA ligase [Halogranum gelatinilyticum]|uniref:Putative ATP-dependent DNA ligase n=1 Tax=Halogranum gelatinilyticum TaxID=660521 RepID=A0A1G9U2Y2_9EURY|nr:RNA ligase [Halogranum gelatinilyticum]SDM54278.1 putative ATP-dependent DNA ligase [Halogranum gelatinilyticum]